MSQLLGTAQFPQKLLIFLSQDPNNSNKKIMKSLKFVLNCGPHHPATEEKNLKEKDVDHANVHLYVHVL